MAKLASLKFNDPAPNVELLDTEGSPVQLASLWKDRVLVLAFTRHFGCPQCKDMTDRLVEVQPQLAEKGLALALVTHATPAEAKEFCVRRAAGIRCLADPSRVAYQAYGLGRGTLWQTLLSPNIWRSNRRLEQTKGYKPETPPPGQDAFQMSGTFVIGTDGRIRLPYYYEDIADHPPVDLLLHGLMGLQWSEPFEKPLHE
ncbi:MAG: AhpC/TSA family protein [Chloroflexi bacterium]|nr:AhpC/TSA family protein [Chloroflexota bacterium]